MTAADRFERAVAAADAAARTREWHDVVAWEEAAVHAHAHEVAPAVADGDVAGLRAQLLDEELARVRILGARARLAAAGPVQGSLDDVVVHVGGLLEDHDHRVDLWRVLVRALARAGRVDDALAALDRAAARRADLGLDASPSLEVLRAPLEAGDPLPRDEDEEPFLLLTPPGGEQHVVGLALDRTISVGRSTDRDVALVWDGEVSRRHLELRPDGGRHVAVDVGSSNGSLLNGRRIHDPLHLVDGDVLRLGSTTLLYRNPAGAPAAAAAIASGTVLRVMPTPSSVVNPGRATPDELDVTILFCDLRGWTTASGQVSPQDARVLLEVFYELGADVVTRHGGTVLQMAGDEIYACFGAPVPRQDHALAGLRAALDLAARESAFAAELEARGLPVVRFGIGCNSGPVAPFAIGGADRRQLGLVGTTVNVAARLCSVAGPGQVVFAETLRERGAGDGLGVSLGPLDLKNVATPVQAYCIER